MAKKRTTKKSRKAAGVSGGGKGFRTRVWMGFDSNENNGRLIKPLTVQEILDGEHVQKM